MPSRKSFIAGGAAVAAAGLASLADTPPSAAAPKPPTPFALAQAKELQKVLPHAHLTDELVQKIAGDIDQYAPTAADFRKVRLRNWDEPDFVFKAGPEV